MIIFMEINIIQNKIYIKLHAIKTNLIRLKTKSIQELGIITLLFNH